MTFLQEPFSLGSGRKSGRRRWNVGGGGYQDSMDDFLDEIGTSAAFGTKKAPSPVKYQPTQQPSWKPAPVKKKSIIPDFDDDDDDDDFFA